MFISILLLNVIPAALLSLAAPTVTPSVKLDSAGVTGVGKDSVDKFLGLPFALPPTGDRRFRKPVKHSPYEGYIDATRYGPSCIQQRTPPTENVTLLLKDLLTGADDLRESEDCLTLNVIRPSTSTPESKYPVVVWIYGGGFQEGSSEEFDILGTQIVQRSVAFNSPVIFVSINYRLTALGFLASKEVLDDSEGNMGLLDQRMALTWVQKYIGDFGGDKSKVMLGGQSAGAISISLQMLAYGGTTNDLFHAAFMMSGAPSPIGNMTGGQKFYDFLVQETRCNTGTQTTLECLRNLPIDVLMAAVNKTPGFLSFESLVPAWAPRADFKFLLDNPQKLVEQGKVASIPFVSGNCDDEGPIFSVSNLNVTTDPAFREYVSTNYVPTATSDDLAPLFTLYPSDPSAGSPFDTGSANMALNSSQFKRLAAFQGDLVFQGPRRFFLNKTSGSMNVWSYLSKRQKQTPLFGSFHGSDLRSGLLTDFIIRMAVNHNPDNGTSPTWPQYTPEERSLYTFGSNNQSLDITITKDDFREAQLKYLTELALEFAF